MNAILTTGANDLLSPNDLIREYDNRAKVADFGTILRGWELAAARFRAAHGHAELDVTYGPSPRQAMDIFWPDARRDVPTAMFLHGGYWQAMDRRYFSHLAAGCLGNGIAIAMPSYDLCPDVSLAEIIAQMRAATRFLHQRAGGPNLIIGHSAGGHLAACLLATDWAAHGVTNDIALSVLSISGLFDLAPLLHTPLNGALHLDAAEAERLSPCLWPRPQEHGAGRIDAVVGGEEGVEYLRQSRSIAEAWGGTWEAVAGENHFSVIAPLADPHSALMRRALATLQRN